MSTPGPVQRHGEAFDAVAEAYDAVRPGYPEELVDTACAIGGLDAGSRVLEIGCGTGKLTEALVERGLRVDAVDPGPNMIELARRRTGHSAGVEFHVGRFEDFALLEGTYDAVFSATAFHWVDPAVGWAKAARALRPGGLLALLMHVHYREEETAEASDALREVFMRHLPDHGTWQPLRDLATLRAGAEERRDNVSAVWTWLGHHDLTRPEAAPLFGDARLTALPVPREQTADELWAGFETSSSYLRREPRARAALESEVRATVPSSAARSGRATSPSSSPPTARPIHGEDLRDSQPALRSCVDDGCAQPPRVQCRSQDATIRHR